MASNNIDLVKDCIQTNRIISEMVDAYIEESVAHFMTNRCINIDEEPRWMYNITEVNKFKREYIRKGGKLSDLNIERIQEEKGGRKRGKPYWEIMRKRYKEKYEEKEEQRIEKEKER